MAIRTTDITADNGDYFDIYGFRLFSIFSIVVLLLVSSIAPAREWRVTPTVDVGGTFSDNINLGTSGTEKSAFIGEINPGISMRNRGRLTLDLDYRMQNLYNQGGDGGYEINHQLEADASAELVKRRFFIDAASTASQQNLTNTGRNASDNLSSSGNRTDVYTFRVNPYWRPRLNGYVAGEVGAGFETARITSGAVSDSNTYFANVNLVSGHRFSRVTWAANYNNSRESRDSDNDNDVSFRNYDATLRFHLNRKFNVFINGGYIDNEFQTNTDTNQNGEFYTAGLGWNPNRWIGFEGSAGQNLYTATVKLNPTRRTTLQATYRNSDVGSNTGTTWNGLIRHRTRRTIFEGRYFEDTTTSQGTLIDRNFFRNQLDDIVNQISSGDITSISDFNNRLNESVTGSLRDEVFTRRRGEFSFTGFTGKSTVRLTAYHEDTTFQVSNDEEQSIGAIASWNWQLTNRMRSIFYIQWDRNSDGGSARRDNRWDVSLALARNLATFKNYAKAMFATVEYRYITQSSSLAANEFDENRISANINVRF